MYEFPQAPYTQVKKEDLKTVEPGPAYEFPQAPYTQVKRKDVLTVEPGPAYEFPQAPYTQVKKKDVLTVEPGLAYKFPQAPLTQVEPKYGQMPKPSQGYGITHTPYTQVKEQMVKPDPWPAYGCPEAPYTQIKEKSQQTIEPGPTYDLPRPQRGYSQIKRKNIPLPTADIAAESDNNEYEEISPMLSSAPQIRPRSSCSNLTNFTPEQMSLLHDLLQRESEGDIHSMTSQPVPLYPQPPQEALSHYHDTVIRPVDKKHPLYSKPGNIEEIYDSIEDDDDDELVPIRPDVSPPVPPKPAIMKRSAQQQSKPKARDRKVQPSIGNETRQTTGKLHFFYKLTYIILLWCHIPSKY